MAQTLSLPELREGCDKILNILRLNFYLLDYAVTADLDRKLITVSSVSSCCGNDKRKTIRKSGCVKVLFCWGGAFIRACRASRGPTNRIVALISSQASAPTNKRWAQGRQKLFHGHSCLDFPMIMFGGVPPDLPRRPRFLSNGYPVRSRPQLRPLSGGSRCWRRGEIDPPTISRQRRASRISEPAASVERRTRQPLVTWTCSTRSDCDIIQD